MCVTTLRPPPRAWRGEARHPRHELTPSAVLCRASRVCCAVLCLEYVCVCVRVYACVPADIDVQAMRALLTRIDEDFDSVVADLEEMRAAVLRGRSLASVTADTATLASAQPHLDALLDATTAGEATCSCAACCTARQTLVPGLCVQCACGVHRAVCVWGLCTSTE